MTVCKLYADFVSYKPWAYPNWFVSSIKKEETSIFWDNIISRRFLNVVVVDGLLNKSSIVENNFVVSEGKIPTVNL
jgi:hypothetical protein